MKAEVHLQSEVQSGDTQSGMAWSHTFKDGEKAELPMAPPEAPPGMKIFLKVELKKNGGNTHFKVLCNRQVIVKRDNVCLILLESYS